MAGARSVRFEERRKIKTLLGLKCGRSPEAYARQLRRSNEWNKRNRKKCSILKRKSQKRLGVPTKLFERQEFYRKRREQRIVERKEKLMALRPCFNNKNCGEYITVDDRPFVTPWSVTGKKITPKLEGPWICSKCRQVPSLLRLARSYMSVKLGENFNAKSKVKEDDDSAIDSESEENDYDELPILPRASSGTR